MSSYYHNHHIYHKYWDTLQVKGQPGPFLLMGDFDLILYVPSTIFQLYRDGSSWVEPVLSLDKCVLLKDLKAVTLVRLEPAALWSRVKHSTTEPLPSLLWVKVQNFQNSELLKLKS